MSFVQSQRRNFASSWKVLPFNDAIGDVTGGNAKVKTCDYLTEGKLPIIDQGKEYIAGFVNDVNLACKVNLPCILFGDHTRIFKYVDFPFALGADGVKVLSPRDGIDTRFAFHYLQTVRLPEDLGYSRHFKYLREACVPRPSLHEQRRIADILDKADAIRRKRREAIELTEELLSSAFLEMFGDPVTNPKGWEVKPLGEVVRFQTGKLDSNAAVEGGRYPFFTCSRETSRIDTYAFDCEALLLAGNNATADYSVKRYSGKFNAYQRTYVITRRSKSYSYAFLRQSLQFKLQELKRSSKGTNTKYLTLGILKSLKIQVPDSEAQMTFERFNEQVLRLREKEEELMIDSSNLFLSLESRAFSGRINGNEES